MNKNIYYTNYCSVICNMKIINFMNIYFDILPTDCKMHIFKKVNYKGISKYFINNYIEHMNEEYSTYIIVENPMWSRKCCAWIYVCKNLTSDYPILTYFKEKDIKIKNSFYVSCQGISCNKTVDVCTQKRCTKCLNCLCKKCYNLSKKNQGICSSCQ